MIEPMTRLTLFAPSEAKDQLLQTLQEFGHCHIDALDEMSSEQDLQQKKESIELALDTLREIRRQSKKFIKSEPYQGSPEKWIEEVLQGARQIEKLNTQLSQTEKLLLSAKMWQSLPSTKVSALRNAGIPLRLFVVSKEDSQRIKPEVADACVEVGASHDSMFLLAIHPIPVENLSNRYLREIAYPEEGIETLQLEKSRISKEIERIEAWLLSGIRHIRFLRNLLAETNDLIQMVKAQKSVEEDRYLSKMKGWVPRKHLKGLEAVLAPWPVMMVAERPKELHDIPISLRHNALGRLFLPLTRLFSLPSYTELDPTLFFAPFFTLYFGICGADLGYGLIMLTAAVLTRIFSPVKTIQDYASLGIVLSVATLIAGLFYGVFFGSPISTLPFLAPLGKLTLFHDNASAFSFALLIGVVQLMTGYALRMVNRVVQLGSAGWLQPLGILLLLLGVFWMLMIPYGANFNPAGLDFGYKLGEMAKTSLLPYVLMALGTVLILFFSDVHSVWWRRPLSGLWELYNLATSVPTDVLSYLRLFALGLSGALLGNAVNQVALTVYSGTWISWFFMALVWLFGHSINLGLVMLSAFVHPLRLTFVEFYKSMEFKGGGKQYLPFSKSIKKSYTP